jgi:tetratricopeptide (TPR) repeat protein
MKAAEHITRAKASMERLRFAEAEESFRKAEALDNRNLEALLGLARIALLQERAGDGLAILDRIFALRPEHPEALALRGLYWVAKGDFGSAIQSLEQARTKDGANPMIHLNLGKCYLAAGRPGPAEESLRAAIRLSPGQRYVQAWLALGSMYERTGRLDLAVGVYRSALRRDPSAVPLLERLASVLAAVMDFRCAAAVTARILKKRKFFGDYLRLGTYAVALGKLEEAEKAFRNALALNSESWEAHYNLAELYMAADLMEQAREHYRAAVQHGGDRFEPLNGMGLFLLTVDQDWERAIELLKQAEELAPSRPEPKLNLALAYAKIGDAVAARTYADAVLSVTRPGNSLHTQADRLKAALRLENHSLRAVR